MGIGTQPVYTAMGERFMPLSKLVKLLVYVVQARKV